MSISIETIQNEIQREKHFDKFRPLVTWRSAASRLLYTYFWTFSDGARTEKMNKLLSVNFQIWWKLWTHITKNLNKHQAQEMSTKLYKGPSKSNYSKP